MLDEEPASPVILASKLDQPLGTIAYHVRTLYDLGLLKLVSTRQRRGATEHYYKTVGHPQLSDDSWDGLDTVSKQRLLTAQLTKAHEYATRSAAAGGFDRADAAFTTTSLKLDEKGWTELAGEAKKWLAKAEDIERKAAARIEKNPESELDVGLTVQLFEALRFSSSVPDGNDSNAGVDGTADHKAAGGGRTAGRRKAARA